MSRANEIVSMLTAGVSVPRFLLPLIAMGLLTTAVSFGLNYSLAAHAERARKAFFENITRGGVRDVVLNGQIFRNRTDNRTWFIAHLKLSSNEFTGVHVIQQDAQDNIVTAYIATTATYVPETREWNFNLAKEVHYDATGNITSEHILPVIHIPNWSETPYRLRSANVRAELLSVPELRDYLHFNSDFPHTLLAPYNTHLQYRVALPWTCLVVVFMAAPLGIGFSRRGILSSVATAIVLVFSMNFLTHLFLALGEGDRIVPWIAAWTPNIIFGTIGLYLLRLRATNRETPGFNPAAFWRKLVAR
jgi:lipopolysaccharide export system permease protein